MTTNTEERAPMKRLFGVVTNVQEVTKNANGTDVLKFDLTVNKKGGGTRRQMCKIMGKTVAKHAGGPLLVEGQRLGMYGEWNRWTNANAPEGMSGKMNVFQGAGLFEWKQKAENADKAAEAAPTNQVGVEEGVAA